jgi:hypothetical protein
MQQPCGPIAPRGRCRHNDEVSAEQLIALEAALTQLSALYTAARIFAPLRHRAETVLLPQLLDLGSRLRQRLRVKQLAQEDVDRAAQEILSLNAAWRAELEEVRTSPVYHAAQTALAAGRQEDLARLLPQLLAAIEVVQPAGPLFFPVSPSSGVRRPGASPFLSPEQCADHIVETLATGVVAEETGSEWWERDWPCIVCTDDPQALDTPIALRLEQAGRGATVFAMNDEPTFRIFTRCLHAPMSAVLANQATDEWWQAYEDSYQVFRDALQEELARRGVQAGGE